MVNSKVKYRKKHVKKVTYGGLKTSFKQNLIGNLTTEQRYVQSFTINLHVRRLQWKWQRINRCFLI